MLISCIKVYTKCFTEADLTLFQQVLNLDEDASSVL